MSTDEIESLVDFLADSAKRELDTWTVPGYMLRRARLISEEYDDDKNGAELLYRARHGDPDADAALCVIASEFIEDGHALPPNLGLYVSSVLSKRYYAPGSRKRGMHPRNKAFRNDFIVRKISLLEELGFSATKSSATDKESGCTIVSKVLAKIGEDIGERGVEEVWSQRDKWAVR